MARYRIGVDVGGTHTDLVLTDDEARAYRIEKVPSTPHNPAIAVLAGVRRLIDSGVAADEIAYFAHGTTATTNALLEMNGARTGVLINEGLSGVFEVQSQGRDGWSPFDHFFRRPEPLARPRFMRGVKGRINYRGQEIEPLDEDGVRTAVRDLAGLGVESIAVCFVFSFMNDAHEKRVAQIVREEAPGVLVIDKREPGGYITPHEAAGEDATYISRIREDNTVENGLAFWCVSDNLRKGAALNAVQIAEVLVNRKLITPKAG